MDTDNDTPPQTRRYHFNVRIDNDTDAVLGKLAVFDTPDTLASEWIMRWSRLMRDHEPAPLAPVEGTRRLCIAVDEDTKDHLVAIAQRTHVTVENTIAALLSARAQRLLHTPT